MEVEFEICIFFEQICDIEKVIESECKKLVLKEEYDVKLFKVCGVIIDIWVSIKVIENSQVDVMNCVCNFKIKVEEVGIKVGLLCFICGKVYCEEDLLMVKENFIE